MQNEELKANNNGNYYYYPKKDSPFPYGICALEGYDIIHVTFAKPQRWDQGNFSFFLFIYICICIVIFVFFYFF